MKFTFVTRLLLPLVATTALAQNLPPSEINLIRNGSFEKTSETLNLWTGVDKDGFITGFCASLPVLNESGHVSEMPMPLSVAIKDIDNDTLPDIATADPLGYVRFYLNSGTKDRPKFSSGFASTPYLSFNDGLPPPKLPGAGWDSKRALLWSQRRMGLKISLTDLGGGRLGLIAGNYFGDIFLVPQSGQMTFPQPEPVDKAIFKLSKAENIRWGNVFAPVMHDWDGDRKADLIIGEGSYSANNVHFLPNGTSTAAPSFKLDERTVLAVGKGRQQLTPAIADFNGDGSDDIIVADSRGHLTAYLRPASWKKGESIEPSGYLAKSGGLTQKESQAFVLGVGIHTVATGDLDGDNLFDIIVGKPNGRAAWAANKGTREQPKFDVLSDLTGDKPTPGTWFVPSQWDMDIGERRGNFFAYASCVSDREDPNVDAQDGSRALKLGFTETGASPLGKMHLSGSPTFKIGEYKQGHTFYDAPLGYRLLGAPNRTFMLQQRIQLENGKSYHLSLQHKGSGVARANVFIGWWGFKALGENKVTRGARGATSVEYNHANEHENICKDFKPSAAWSTLDESFTVNFKNKDLKDQTTTHKAIIIIVFELTSPSGVVYLDDIKLTPSI